MNRSISTVSLLFTSVSAILGSGWLFTAYYAAQYAGSASILSWLIGGIMIVVVAFVFAEVCAMIPVTGSSSRVPHLTHGTIVSFIFAWIIWLTYQALGPTEVQAMLQYLGVYFPKLLHADQSLSLIGFGVASLLLLIVSIINVFSMRWLININNILTLMKLIIPLIIGLTLIFYFFTPERVIHTGGDSFMPYGMNGVFKAISAGGVVFAFNAFKLSSEMAGDAKNPGRALPIAIVGSVLICMILYLLLQVGFLSALTPKNLEGGWQHFQLENHFGPFAAIAAQSNLHVLLPIIFIGAMVGPFAAALVYVGSGARSLFGMSKNAYIPKFFSILTGQRHPILGIIFYFFFGILMFLPFDGWAEMVSFLTSLLALTYAIMPICFLTLRYRMKHYPRPLKLPLGYFWGLLAFYACSLMLYWNGWRIISKMSIVVFLGLLVLSLYRMVCAYMQPRSQNDHEWNILNSIWFWFYFIGMTILSYVGNFDGGQHDFSAPMIMTAIFILCCITCFLSVCFSHSSDTLDKSIRQILRDEHAIC